MDEFYHSPLLDLFRRGEVPVDVRMLAARGVLAPRAHEQVALLALLTSDGDPAISQVAEETIGKIPGSTLSAFLARPDTSADTRAFFERRGIVPADAPAADAEADEPLITGDDDGLDGASDATGEPVPAAGGIEVPPGMYTADGDRIPTVQRLSRLTITQRIKVAMRGTREERTVLIRDPNKLVAMAVLSSPKVTGQEAEGFARMTSVSEDVLRVIGTGRAWIKNYGVVAGLVFNPKTPVAISMGFVSRLTERDIRMLATSRNVPEVLRILARKVMQSGQARRR